MMKTILKIFLLTICLGGSAQASDIESKTALIQSNMKAAARLEGIAGPLKIAGAPQCDPHVQPYSGAEFMTLDSVSGSYQEVMSNYGIKMQPTVSLVGKQTPAAGKLMVGDVITHIDSKAVPSGYDGLDAVKAAIANTNGVNNLLLRVKRENTQKTITLSPVLACASPVRLDTKDGKKVYENDGKIMVSKEFLNTQNDDTIIADKIKAVLF